jgi:putative sterol carrier protein/putative NADPH-quinone reductase
MMLGKYQIIGPLGAHHPSGKEKPLKVLALNSSPRGEGQSKTELLLSHLVQGMQAAGAQVEVVHLRQQKIKNCIGCFTCWTKTPGVCIHKDDMSATLFPKFLAAELVVYATPLYHFTVNAALKAFIERTLPVLQPFLVEHEGRTVHPLRHPHPGMVMLSVAGFHEPSVFDQLSSWARFIFGKKLLAELYRPGAEALTTAYYAPKAQSILVAAHQAGRDLVENRQVSAETLAQFEQDIVEDPKVWRTMGNLMWTSCITEGLTVKEFAERGRPPRPDSLESFMMLMAMGFNPKKAGDTRALIQFEFSGEVAGTCHFKIAAGVIQAFDGAAAQPSLVVRAPFGVWMDILTGKGDGQQLLLSKAYTVEGDLALLMRFDQIFGR